MPMPPLLSTPGLYRPQLGPVAQARPGFEKMLGQPGDLSFMDKLLAMFSGAGTPGSTDQLDASNQAGRAGMLQAGLALLAAPHRQGDSLGQNVAQAFGYGQQAGSGQYDKLQRQQAVEGLGLPPQMAALAKLMSPDQLAQLMPALMPQPEDPYTLGPNESRFRGSERIAFNPAAAPEPPADIQTFREYVKMTPEERAAFDALQAAKRGPGTIVNVGAGEAGVQKAIGEAAYTTISGDDAAATALQKVDAIDRVIGIVDNPKFKDVSGPLFGGTFGELSARFAGDPEARQLLAEFNALGGQMTMAQLEAFTGPKTDFEFQQAKRLVFNDTKMTPEEVAAGLRVHRSAAIAQAQKWAKDLLDMDPKRLKFDPQDIAPQLELARQIVARYGEVAPTTLNDPLGIRPR